MRTTLSHRSADSAEGYELPTFESGAMLIPDRHALKDLLDEEDLERALRRRS